MNTPRHIHAPAKAPWTKRTGAPVGAKSGTASMNSSPGAPGSPGSMRILTRGAAPASSLRQPTLASIAGLALLSCATFRQCRRHGTGSRNLVHSRTLSMPPEEPTMALSAEGYTDLPPGKIAAVVTFLEMRERPLRPVRPAGPFGLTPIGDDIERYRALFRRVGAPWLWFSRLVMPEPELRAILADPAIEALALRAATPISASSSSTSGTRAPARSPSLASFRRRSGRAPEAS